MSEAAFHQLPSSIEDFDLKANRPVPSIYPYQFPRRLQASIRPLVESTFHPFPCPHGSPPLSSPLPPLQISHLFRHPSNSHETDRSSDHRGHQLEISGGSMVLYRITDAHGALSQTPPFGYQFPSTITRNYASSDKPPKHRKLVAYVYDPYDDQELDDDDWLHDPRSDIRPPGMKPALPWRGILNIGFLVFLLLSILFLFIGFPIYEFSKRTAINTDSLNSTDSFAPATMSYIS